METILKIIKSLYVVINVYVTFRLNMVVFYRDRLDVAMEDRSRVEIPLMAVVLLIEMNFILGFLAVIRESRSLVVVNALITMLTFKLLVLSTWRRLDSGLMVAMFVTALMAIPLNLMIKTKEKRRVLASGGPPVTTISQGVNFDPMVIGSPSRPTNRTTRPYSYNLVVAESSDPLPDRIGRLSAPYDIPIGEPPPPYEDCPPPKYEDVFAPETAV